MDKTRHAVTTKCWHFHSFPCVCSSLQTVVALLLEVAEGADMGEEDNLQQDDFGVIYRRCLMVVRAPPPPPSALGVHTSSSCPTLLGPQLAFHSVCVGRGACACAWAWVS